MKFKAKTRRKAIEYEKDIVKYWKENQTFEKSVEQRPKENSYVFYDGPPFISGDPHHGTLLSSIVKDAVPRFWTMKGKRVERVWGWDCHGLPAERFTEKKLSIHSREEVLDFGLEKYVNAVRKNMVQTSNAWEDTIDRIGRWVEFKGAYKTMDKNYMESIWWAFKELYEKGKIYEGEKVLMYCTLDGTPLSKAEVTMDSGAYQEITDPSVYVKFELNDFKLPNPGDIAVQMPDTGDKNAELAAKEHENENRKILRENKESPVYMLAWTTTPWTLPANTALAINSHEVYDLVFVNNQFLIINTSCLDKVLKGEDYSVVRGNISGNEFIGMTYKPLFGNRGKKAHKIWSADYVGTETGTGIVHLAPTYGEEDFILAQKEGFPAVHTIDENGLFTEGPWKGRNVWEINKQIAKDMNRYSTETLQGEYANMTNEERIEFHKTNEPEPNAAIWKVDYIKHSYPHCHRCNTKLMYRAHPSWFMDIDEQRTRMLELNQNINWFPSHLKEGRFAKNILAAPDWNISRDRFWATAMPVWKSESGKTKVIGSYAELKELSGVELEDYHRPWIDDVTFKIDGETYTRIDKVMDSWFEAGSMPFAQFHYPFENKQKFEQNFPGDFIVEYIGQVRAWFYYMLAVSTALFGKESFQNVITTGTLAGNDGRKMSKSLGNYTDPNALMDQFSADALRLTLLSSPVLAGEDFALIDKDVSDVNRKLAMIWNMYDFFTLYAEVDKWEWDNKVTDPAGSLNNQLDLWAVSRVHEVTKQVEAAMESYDLPSATRPLFDLIEDMSNWYVRRSRRRFWKSEDDQDKNDAYKTLHYILVQMSIVFAPFAPFLSEELYRKLTGGESVHLLNWPERGHSNNLLLEEMELAREVINAGLSLRAKNQIKVRQPLRSIILSASIEDKIKSELLEVIQEELNIKTITFSKNLAFKEDDKTQTQFAKKYVAQLDTNIDQELRLEGIMRDIVRQIQSERKAADLDVDDRIELAVETDDKMLQETLKAHKPAIMQETLANNLTTVAKTGSEHKINGVIVKIAVKKAQ